MSDSESDAEPPQKRQRNNSDGDLRTRSVYWFKDGNVVLQTENTLFRVHQSILSRYSQIFEDTFSMPQNPSQENEVVEGCPVIPLSDTAEDMGNIISLLYDSDKTINFYKKFSGRAMGSMIRLGRKYVITYLEHQALGDLHKFYPTSLEAWDSPQYKNIPLINTTTFISIAHEFQLFTILPAAYVHYLQNQTLEDLLNDARIPEKAREHCIIGHARILEYVKGSIVDGLCPPFLPSKGCSGGKCDVNRWETIKNLPVWQIKDSRRFGIFDPWKGSGSKATENLCSRCRAEVKTLTEKIRSEFWSILPTLFGLPSWADLKDDI